MDQMSKTSGTFFLRSRAFMINVCSLLNESHLRSMPPPKYTFWASVNGVRLEPRAAPSDLNALPFLRSSLRVLPDFGFCVFAIPRAYQQYARMSARRRAQLKSFQLEENLLKPGHPKC